MRPEVLVYTAPEQWTPAPPEVQGWFGPGRTGEAFEAQGYACLSPHSVTTLDTGAFTQWVTTASEAVYRHALLVRVAARETIVLCPTTPDLLAYLGRYGALATVVQLARDVEALREMLERLFLAWHGHVQEATCARCNTEPGKTHAMCRAAPAASPPAVDITAAGKTRRPA